MSNEWYSAVGVILLAGTSLVLLISGDWRVSIAALAGQYAGAFLLVSLNWPVEMAVSKLIAGWIASAVLGMGIMGLPKTDPSILTSSPRPASGTRSASTPFPSSRLFHLLAAALVWLTTFSLTPQLMDLMRPLTREQAWGALLLIGMGLLQLGLSAMPLRTIFGLLTVLTGFEVLYAVIERSALVAGLLAAVNLGLALAGAYLLLAPEMEQTE